MDTDQTSIFTLDALSDELIRQVLNEVYKALEERGYNPINQMVGYLMSGDLGYISSHKDARKKISRIDRNQIIEFLLRAYLKD
ncbi:MAG: IreB family regulatory phosphoprotein [Bacilli bacterium]